MVILAWPFDAGDGVDGDRSSCGVSSIRTSPWSSGRACGLPAVRPARTQMAVAGGGQPGTCRSTLTTSCTGHGVLQQRRDAVGRHAAASVRRPRRRCAPAASSPGCELRMAGTLLVTAQSPSATSSCVRSRIVLDLFQVVLAADRAFDQRHVHVLGKLLRIHQRAVDDVGLLRPRRRWPRRCRAATCGSRSSRPATP